MASGTGWEITGYRERPVPNRFFQAGESASSELGLLLPGIRYTNDAPLLYYARNVLLSRATDVLAVDYRYGFDRSFTELPAEAREKWMRADLEALHRKLAEQSGYARLTVIGKSLGTIVASRLLGYGLRQELRAVWLTPVLSDEGVVNAVGALAQPSYLAIGTADRYYDAEVLKGLRENGALTVLEMDGADHSLEIKGDVPRSIELLRRYVTGLDHFLG